MRCPYCREEISSGARKCRHCQKFLEPGVMRNVTAFVRGMLALFTVLIPVVSLAFAYEANQSRDTAVEDRNDAEIAKSQALELQSIAEKDLRTEKTENLEASAAVAASIIETVGRGITESAIQSVAVDELSSIEESSGFKLLEQGNFAAAVKAFEQAIEDDPENFDARQGLIFAEILKAP